MKINAFTFNPFGEITYVVWDETTREAAIVDPGMITADERRQLDDFISRHELKVKYLLNTHLHLDHAFGNRHIERTYGVATSAHQADAALGADIAAQGARFGIPASMTEGVTIANPLTDGQRLPLGDEYLEVIAVPGHSPGSIALYDPDSNFVLAGDTLFNRGVGRTDLPGGSQEEILRSIRDRLYRLPDDTLVCPGHGPTTTIGDEKRSNPWTR